MSSKISQPLMAPPPQSASPVLLYLPSAKEPSQQKTATTVAAALAEMVSIRGMAAGVRDLLNALPEPAYIKDVAGRFLLLNQAAADLFGAGTPAAAIGKTKADFYPPELAAEIVADDQQVIRTGEPVVNRLDCLIERNGVKRWLLTTKAPVRDETGAIVAIVGTAKDVTAVQASAQAALRESDARLQAVWEASADAIALFDANGVVLAVNPAYCALYGYDEHELVGQSFALAFPEGERSTAEISYRAMFGTPNQPAPFESRVQRGDGTFRHVESRAAYVEQNEVRTAMIVTVRDVTERKRIEAALLEAEERFRSAFEAAAIGIALLAPGGRLMQVNRAFCDILDYPEEVLLSKNIQELTHPDDLPTDRVQMSRLMAGEIDSYQLEKRYIRKDGTIVWAHLAVSLVRDHNGVPQYFVGQVEDVTPRKVAEAAAAEDHARLEASNRQLEYQNTAKSVFVSVISHEFRTPLTNIQGFSELIAREVETLAEAQGFALIINQSAERLTRLVNDVLDLNRIIAGHATMEVRPVNLHALIATALQPFGTTARHQLKVRLAATQSKVHGDPDRLTQVVTNLVANAIKYAPAGGSILVTTLPHPEGIELTVADQGLGVPEEHRESIFEPYGRIARPEQSMIPGTGLGLPICRQIVTLHGGRIWVEPNAPQGSIFHVMLPINDSSSAGPAP